MATARPSTLSIAGAFTAGAVIGTAVAYHAILRQRRAKEVHLTQRQRNAVGPVLERLQEDFGVSDQDLGYLLSMMTRKMNDGLGSDTQELKVGSVQQLFPTVFGMPMHVMCQTGLGTVQMLASYVTSLPSGAEKGRFLALDLGGTPTLGFNARQDRQGMARGRPIRHSCGHEPARTAHPCR